MGTIPEEHLAPLLLLQQKILEHLESIGNFVTWDIWRSITPTPGTPIEKFKAAPENFVDGEVIDAFLKLDERSQQTVAEDVVMAHGHTWGTVGDIRRTVEELKRLR